MKREDIDYKIDGYIVLFDYGIDGYELPRQWTNDPIAAYIYEICKTPGNIELCQDETWKEIFHEIIRPVRLNVLL